jgi:hypothetical protein
MNYEAEFEIVDLILASDFETRGVDAFSLCVLKMERQMRRLFTHLIYQCPDFNAGDVPELIKVLSDNKKIYFRHFIAGIDSIYPKPVSDVYGATYQDSLGHIDKALGVRNKVFHGQLTGNGLSREQLLAMVSNIRCWSSTLATSFLWEYGYDGFARNSFQKSKRPETFKEITWPFSSTQEYEGYLGELSKCKKA